ncbi:MAG: DEAD/DEAH box helicase [Methanobacteriota archaeon]|nr:MAG: DEAD/DEAH box helicase [Euryarchaeota archaeon]
MSFEELGINKRTSERLRNLGYEKPTEVQKKTIPLVLEGKQVLVLSKTGSGKTAAFLLPLVESKEKALVLAPTRELALQIKEEAKKIMPHKKVLTIYGGTSVQRDEEMLQKHYDILVATPGRCLDHVRRGNLPSFDVVVLDEADKMVEMGFIEDVRDILSNVEPKKIHLFSATATRELRDMFNSEFEEIFLGEDKPEIVEEEVKVERRRKLSTLMKHLDRNKKTIIFMGTKRGTMWLADKLKEKRIKCSCINGDMSQRKREKAVELFKKGIVSVLVATDVVARGIHIDDVDLVINYDQARDEKTHKHRVGRTGRMGKKGKAITFVEGLPVVRGPRY